MRAKSRCLFESLESRRMFVVTVFTVDPAQSSLTISGDFQDGVDTGTLVDAGAVVADYSGTMTIDVTPTQLDITDSSLVAGDAGGTFQPGGFDANYAFTAQLAAALDCAIRTLELSLTGTAAVDVNGNVDISALVASAPEGTLDSQLQGQPASSTQDPLSAFNWSLGTPPGQATIATVGPTTTLTIPITLNFSGNIQSTVSSDLQLTGTIVAIAQPDLGSISGLVIDDQDDDGTVDAGEPGLSGWTVYIDANTNNTLDIGEVSAITDGTGAYIFDNLADGTYPIAVEVMAGWSPGGATTGTTSETVTGANDVIATSLLFFQAPTVGTITGTVANDENDDGIRQITEPGLNGWTVYIDADNDGVFDAGETSTVTAGGGLYTFSNLAPGTYNIRAVIQQGWRTGGATTGVVSANVTAGNTTAAGTLLYTQIAQFTGVVFNDSNENGVQDAGEFGLSGWTVYIDANKNGIFDFGESSSVTDVSGGFAFNSQAAGNYVVRVNLFSGWRLTDPVNNVNPVQLAPAELKTGVTFALTQTSSISGYVYNDANDNAQRDSTELTKGLVGWTVFIDSNFNGIFDIGEVSATTDVNGKFTFTGLTTGSYRIGLVTQTGWRQTQPVDAIITQSVTAPTPANSLLLGATTNVRIFGTVSNDINDNGKREQSEPRLAGFNVFIDRNSNGKRDPGETIAQSDANGNWVFSGIPAGTYKLGIISQPNWRRNGPKIVTVTLGSGQVSSSIPWRMTQRVRIFGSVFNDLDQSRKRDVGEPVVPGVLVFLDTNGNNKWDADEKARITDANGEYRFTNLKRGDYRIRMTPPSGAIVTRIFNATLKNGEMAERHLGLFSDVIV